MSKENVEAVYSNVKTEENKQKETEESGRLFTIIKLLLSAVMLIVSLVLNLSESVILVLRIAAAFVSGYEIIVKAFKNLLRFEIFDENSLMIIAFVTAFIIGESFEGVLIIILYCLGELLEDLAADKSREKIAGLAELKSLKVNLLSNGKIVETDPESVAVGSFILVKKGERVPIDGILQEGSALLDLKAVTGESRIFTVLKDCEVYSGAVNLGETITVKTVKLYKDSTVERIIAMVENSTERKAKSQKFITSFAKVYTPCVVLAAVLISVVPPLFDSFDFVKWIYKALSFLIISCPCALVISVPLGFFIGIGSLAKRGILVKGGNYVDALAKVGIAAFDKTGTITKGNFAVDTIIPYNGRSNDEILKIACSVEQGSDHPIAKALRSYYSDGLYEIKNVREKVGHGIECEINGVHYAVGNAGMVAENTHTISDPNKTSVFVAENGKTIGKIILSDQIKDESKQLVSALRKVCVEDVVMISGDNKVIVEETAKTIGVDKVFYELLPEQKTAELAKIIKNKRRKGVLYCGDGINDSPSIAMADVGVAMGALGSEAAITCADVVISDDNLLKIPYAIKKAKLIRRKVITNIAGSIIVKIAIMIFSILTTVPLWLAMLGDVGVMLLAVLNSLTISLYK